MFTGIKNMQLQEKAEAIHNGVKVAAGLGVGGTFASWYAEYGPMITLGLGIGTFLIVMAGTGSSIYFRCQEHKRQKVEHRIRVKMLQKKPTD